MKTLLTGANGLVGRAIEADVRFGGSSDLDLTDLGKTYREIKANSPDVVIHTAAKVGGLGANINYVSDFYVDNVLINTNVLEASRRSGVTRLISFLSTCIFPDAVEYPLSEGKLHLGEPHDSNFGYAYAKIMLEVQSRAIRNQYGLNYDCLIPTNIYGPGDNFNIDDGHVLPSLIHKCYLAKQNNEDFVVWGSGKPLREFIFYKDIGEIVRKLIERGKSFGSLIVSPSKEISIGEVAELVAKHLGFRGNIVYDNSKPDGQLRKPTDNSKLMSLLPDTEFTPIEDGICETVEWFVKNYKSCRK
jgi:GDP-L-fucose synthase